MSGCTEDDRSEEVLDVAKYTRTINRVYDEFQKTFVEFQAFHNEYEGYAFIRVDLENLWEKIKDKHRTDEDLRQAAAQMAATVIQFVYDLCPPGPKDIKKREPDEMQLVALKG
jgi:hypothetical protein